MISNTKSLCLVVNVDWFFLSHRLPIALEAKKRGFDVTVFAIEEAGKGDEIRNHGFRFVPLPTSRSGTNLFSELKTLFLLYKYYITRRPDIVHHVALKPVTYGSIAAKLAGLPRVVNALSGLGFLFINESNNKIHRSIVRVFFKYGFRNPNLRFIFQNRDDLKIIKEISFLTDDKLFLIKGSGVDLEEFSYCDPPLRGKLRVLLPARMLWDKGVGEFVNAAKLLFTKYSNIAEFILAGNSDMGNKAGIEEKQLLAWNNEGYVKWIGFQENMVMTIANSHIIVLPSYREGLPKGLIEACAIGRPIVTTDVPGCREVVEDGVNGFLVKSQDSQSLAKKIELLILNEELRLHMGKNGRIKAEQEFSINDVLARTFSVYED